MCSAAVKGSDAISRSVVEVFERVEMAESRCRIWGVVFGCEAGQGLSENQTPPIRAVSGCVCCNCCVLETVRIVTWLSTEALLN